MEYRYFNPVRVRQAERLVIVAGHAILKDFRDPLSGDCWVLQDFQKGEPPFYVEHVRAGVEAAARDSGSLLVFSGGQSRQEAGPRSEAQSYFWIADHYGWFGQADVAHRATTEEFARDSFENLLFGILRFRQCTGRRPAHVTFVSWEFKRQRLELHRRAIGWPPERYAYIGANDPSALNEALAAEERVRSAYAADPFGEGPVLRAKKSARDPFRRQHPYVIEMDWKITG